jgi:chromosomal replication initiation ATPase DnaA
MSKPSAQLPLAFEAKRSYAREDFVPGVANEEALALIDGWPQWPARVCAIWGPGGSGKTHLAQIWRAHAEAVAVEPAALTVELVATLAPKSAFVIDDADNVEGGAALFHLLNFVNQSDGWLLMTGKEPPQRWATKVPDLHSRLTAVPGFALDPPDEALMARALLKLFADRQLKLPEAVIGYLVPRLRRSFADAERIVVLIDTLALQQKRNISVEIGGQALRLLEAERLGPSADNG